MRRQNGSCRKSKHVSRTRKKEWACFVATTRENTHASLPTRTKHSIAVKDLVSRQNGGYRTFKHASIKNKEERIDMIRGHKNTHASLPTRTKHSIAAKDLVRRQNGGCWARPLSVFCMVYRCPLTAAIKCR